MPIYEYACGACGHHFEEWQKMSDPPVRTCPKCKARKVEKLISQTSFTLKGGGWYADLYSAPKPGAKDKDSKDSKSDSGGKSSEGSDSASSTTKDSKSDSKSEKKAESASKKADKKAKKSGAA